MELMEAIRARKSYRNEFYNTPVPRSDLREILEAGLAAPSGCNLQTTQLIAAKGYASVWIEGQIRGERAKEMGALLGVPEEYTVAVYLPVGVPAKSMAEAVKKPFSERAWLNGYQKELD